MKKRLLLCVILIITFLFQGCESDLSPSLESVLETSDVVVEKGFSLRRFENPIVRDHLEVDWENYTELEDENGNLVREFPAYLTINQTLSWGDQVMTQKYSVLASINEDAVPVDFTLLKFLSYDGQNLKLVSFASKKDFSGTLYRYNLLGQIVGLETYTEGGRQNGLSNKGKEIPPVTHLAPVDCDALLEHCDEGRYITVTVQKYTDYYNYAPSINRKDYAYSRFDGTRRETVWVASGSNSNSSYHSHVAEGHGSSGGNSSGGNPHSYERIVASSFVTFAQDYKSQMSSREKQLFESMSSSNQYGYLKSGYDAKNEAIKLFPGNCMLYNGKGDAFRHALWNALSSNSIGLAQTDLLTTAHEEKSSKYAYGRKEKDMDLFNVSFWGEIPRL